MPTHDHDEAARTMKPAARVEVPAERFRAEPARVMQQALAGEVAVLGEDGEARLFITRKLAPLE